MEKIIHDCTENDCQIIIFTNDNQIDEFHFGVRGTGEWTVIGKNDLLCALQKTEEFKWHEGNPPFDGEYLCSIVRHNECGTFSTYQRVIMCDKNMWVLSDERESVSHYKRLEDSPLNNMKLTQSWG